MARTTVRTRARSVAAAALATALLAACGGGGDEETQPTTPAGPTTTTEPPGSTTVRIDYVDFGYTVSGPLVAGGVLQLRNAGKEFHMMGIGRFKEGKTMADLQEALSKMGGPGGPGGGGEGATTTTGRGGTTTTARGGTTTTGRGGTTTTGRGGTTTTTGGPGGGGPDPTAEVLEQVGFPGNVMGPGQSAELTVPNLRPGNYALVCFVPTEGEGAPHVAKGMINELKVVPGSAPGPPTADATYQVAAGRPVQGPSTLTAGRRTLKWEVAPGSAQLEPGVARVNTGRTFDELDRAVTRLFESEAPPPRNVAGQLPGEVAIALFDLEDVTTFYLTMDFKPGNYTLVANDTDPQNRPRPPREIINVRVT